MTSRWSSLDPYLVRVAGFSIARLDPLRCERAAALEAALVETEQRRDAAGAAVDGALDEQRCVELDALGDRAARKALARQVKRVRGFARGTAAEPAADTLAELARAIPRVTDELAALVRAHRELEDRRRTFEDGFAAELADARRALHELYRDPELRESVFLESPEASIGIVQLLAAAAPRNSKTRQRERLAAMYAQRFCAKNDTNSICGPHGLGHLTTDLARPGAAIRIAPGVVRRATYFSHWAAQAVLDEAVRRAGDAAPVRFRIQPSARVADGSVAWCVMTHDATTSFRRRYARSALPPPAVALLRALARPRTRGELHALAAELDLEPDELLEFVDQLTEAGVVLRGPTLAPGSFHPLRDVADELAGWPDGEARRWALAETAALEQLVARFARAPGDDRPAALAALAARFEAATGAAARRGAGQHYADRSVVHEDACVAIEAALGAVRGAIEAELPAVIAAIELPLRLARERVREWFRGRFGADARIATLEAHRAFDEDRVLETPASTPAAAAIRAALARVRALFDPARATSDGVLRVEVAALEGALDELPPARHPGYVSVDLMGRAAARGAELIVGEVHGFFWLPTSFLDVLPAADRDRVVDAMRAAVRDLAGGRTTAECVFLHTQATDRRFPLATTDLQLILPSGRPDAIDLGRLELRLAGDDFEFLHDDHEVIPLVAYSKYPFVQYTSKIAPLFDDFAERFFPDSLLPEALRDGDAPRLVIGDTVVQRRVWRRPVEQLRAALTAGGEAELFRRAQALRRAIGCGDRVFVSVTGEPKPVLIDFRNVFLLEALIHLLDRQGGRGTAKLSEMLPGPDELIARGPDGPRTAELRIGFYRR